MLLALLAMLVATATLCAGCGGRSYQTGVDAALEGASAALVAKDPVAWFRALPPEGKPAQQAWYQTYSGLARFPWAKVSAKARAATTTGRSAPKLRAATMSCL